MPTNEELMIARHTRHLIETAAAPEARVAGAVGMRT
jgi:hypothetical protein